MDISAAGSAIYASYGSPSADALTGTLRKEAQTERQAGESQQQKAQQDVDASSAGRGVTPERGNKVNIVV